MAARGEPRARGHERCRARWHGRVAGLPSTASRAAGQSRPAPSRRSTTPRNASYRAVAEPRTPSDRRPTLRSRRQGGPLTRERTIVGETMRQYRRPAHENQGHRADEKRCRATPPKIRMERKQAGSCAASWPTSSPPRTRRSTNHHVVDLHSHCRTSACHPMWGLGKRLCFRRPRTCLPLQSTQPRASVLPAQR
jgi:hypothetical protein